MSGTGLPYGDRPIALVQGNGAYATNEFYQFLQRLSAANNTTTRGATQMQVEVSALTTEVANLSKAATPTSTARSTEVVAATQPQWPTAGPAFQTEILPENAIALTSGVVSEVTWAATTHGKNIAVGAVYLIGTGSVSVASASMGSTSGVMETEPGAFTNRWFGDPGASPATIGVDLAIGSLTWIPFITMMTTAFLNVRATFTGEISAYGGLIVLPYGS